MACWTVAETHARRPAHLRSEFRGETARRQEKLRAADVSKPSRLQRASPPGETGSAQIFKAIRPHLMQNSAGPGCTAVPLPTCSFLLLYFGSRLRSFTAQAY